MSLAGQRSPSSSSEPGAHTRPLSSPTASRSQWNQLLSSLPLVPQLFQDAQHTSSQEETLDCSLICLGAPSPSGSPEGMSSGQGRSQSPVPAPGGQPGQRLLRRGTQHGQTPRSGGGRGFPTVVLSRNTQGLLCPLWFLEHRPRSWVRGDWTLRLRVSLSRGVWEKRHRFSWGKKKSPCKLDTHLHLCLSVFWNTVSHVVLSLNQIFKTEKTLAHFKCFFF